MSEEPRDFAKDSPIHNDKKPPAFAGALVSAEKNV